jgi:hypothetical protein
MLGILISLLLELLYAEFSPIEFRESREFNDIYVLAYSSKFINSSI